MAGAELRRARGGASWLALAALALALAPLIAASAVDEPVPEEDAPTAAGLPEGAAPCGSSQTQADVEAKVQRIIHGTSAVAALADGGLAQLPGAGALVTPTIQAAMVYAIGKTYGCYLERSTCLTVVTAMASSHMQKALLKEALGWLPGVGNLIKTSVTFLMTEGIGNLAAKTLRCGKADGLIREFGQSDASTPGETADAAVQGRQLFHLFSDYLVNLDFTQLTPDEVWLRVKQLFSTPGQEQLLESVLRAETPQQLMELAKRYTWNLKVVEAALQALMERFTAAEACVGVRFVAERLWTTQRGSGDEARLAALPYLQHCTPRAPAETVRTIVLAATSVVVGSRGGARHGTSKAVVRGALELLELSLETWDSIPGDPSPDGEEASRTPLLPASELHRLLTAAFGALLRGEPAACRTLRALLRLEKAMGLQDGTGQAVEWPSLQRLSKLDALNSPAGAELCAPGLRRDLAERLTLPSLPASAELPADRTPGRRPAPDRTPSATLEARLASVLVGQHCARARLVDDPGHLRSKLLGRWRRDLPLVLLLTGPSGTGKTLLAKTIAEVLLGQEVSQLEAMGRLRVFHMNGFAQPEDKNSFFGPPVGIKGKGELPELLKMWPDAVVILDEIEKADPSFAPALLKVFGESGAIFDSNTGRDVPTSKATFILTSNVAKDYIMAHPAVQHLFSAAGGQAAGADAETESDSEACVQYSRLREDVLSVLTGPVLEGRKNFFGTSEIRGRITDVIPFLPFSPSQVEDAVRRFLSDEAAGLAKASELSHITLAWEPAVVPYFAAAYAKRPEEGLRRIHNDIHSSVARVVGSAVELQLLRDFGAAVLRVSSQGADDSVLDLRVVEPGNMPPRRASAGSAAAEGADTQEGATELDAGRADASGGADWWWPFAGRPASPGSLVGTGTPSASQQGAGPGTAPSWAADVNWERLRAWDRQVAWEQLKDYLWKWKLWIVVVAVVMLVVVSTLAVSGAPAAAAAAGTTAAAGGAHAAAAAAAAVPAGAAGGAAAAAAAPSAVAALLSAAAAVVPWMPWAIGAGGTVLVAACVYGRIREIAACLGVAATLGIVLIEYRRRVWRPQPRPCSSAEKRRRKREREQLAKAAKASEAPQTAPEQPVQAGGAQERAPPAGKAESRVRR